MTVAIGPHPPSAVKAVPGASLGSIRVTWVAPSDTGGVPIAAYFIQYRIRGSTSFTTQSRQPQPTEATITGLDPGTTYQIWLATVTAIGIGPYCCRQNGSEVFARTHDGKQIVQSCNTDANHLVYLCIIIYEHSSPSQDVWCISSSWSNLRQTHHPNHMESPPK